MFKKIIQRQNVFKLIYIVLKSVIVMNKYCDNYTIYLLFFETEVLTVVQNNVVKKINYVFAVVQYFKKSQNLN